MKLNLRSFIAFILLVLTIVILVGSPQPAFTQPPVGGNPCPFPPCNPDVPISGIEILLVAGGALGVRRILSAIKKSKAQ